MADSLVDKYLKKQQAQSDAESLVGKKQNLEAELWDVDRDLKRDPDSPSLVGKYKSIEQNLGETDASLKQKTSELEGLISEEDKAKFAQLGIKGEEATQEGVAAEYEKSEKEGSNRHTQLDQNLFFEKNAEEPANPVEDMGEDAKKGAVEAARPVEIVEVPEENAAQFDEANNRKEEALESSQSARSDAQDAADAKDYSKAREFKEKAKTDHEEAKSADQETDSLVSKTSKAAQQPSSAKAPESKKEDREYGDD